MKGLAMPRAARWVALRLSTFFHPMKHWHTSIVWLGASSLSSFMTAATQQEENWTQVQEETQVKEYRWRVPCCVCFLYLWLSTGQTTKVQATPQFHARRIDWAKGFDDRHLCIEWRRRCEKRGVMERWGRNKPLAWAWGGRTRKSRRIREQSTI